MNHPKIPSIGTTQNGRLLIDIPRLMETRLLIQSNSGGGKSWALRRILEQCASFVQQIILDSEGEFASLREKFDYIIAAPHDADALANPRTAALLARRLLETGVSAVIDIYDMKAHERQAFVRIFMETLVNAPKKLWHPVMIVLDEAHVFCSERGKSESSDAVIDIATRGRKRGFCLIAATQRLSKLHKDVAAEMGNKMIGRTGLDVDIRRAADELGMTSRQAWESLRDLPPGDFYVYGPALCGQVTLVTVGSVVTRHPKAGQRFMTAPSPPSEKIKKVLSELGDLPKEAEQEAKTLSEMRTEITRLKRTLSLSQKKALKMGVPELEAKRREKKAVEDAIINLRKDVKDNNSKKFVTSLNKIVSIATATLNGRGSTPDRPSLVGRQSNDFQKHVVAPAEKLASLIGLRSGAVRILQELAARYPAGYSKSQVGTLTKFSPKGGTFNTYLGDLRRSGFIESRLDLIYVTESGIESLGDRVPNAPTSHEEVMALWRKSLRAGAYRMLEGIVSAGENGICREDIAIQVGMERTGGTFNTYLGDLRRNGLITETTGVSVASDVLFP